MGSVVSKKSKNRPNVAIAGNYSTLKSHFDLQSSPYVMEGMKHVVKQTWGSPPGPPITEAYLTPPNSVAISHSSPPNIYYSAETDFHADPHPTYVKFHQGEYKRVYRLAYPYDGPMTREYVFQELPQLNLSSKITRSVLDSRPIASGGFSDVHRCTVNGKTVAIKVMRTSLEQEQLTKVERVSLRELFTWSQLTHDNILELLGYTFDYYPPCVSFVSSWQENGNATSYLRGKDLNVVRQVWRSIKLAGAVRGLKYLHGKQMVHGDFRGNNILIDQKGEALVADFGFARILELAGLSSVSPPGGNVRWMAPELLVGVSDEGRECTHTKESDMWSLGMTILELCSSELPYCDSLREAHVLLTVVRGGLPRKHDRVPALLWQICTELWCINARGRLTIDEATAILIFETRVASSTPTELLTELLNSQDLRVTGIVIRARLLANIDVGYWRDSLQGALSKHCHNKRVDKRHGFSGPLLRHLVELEVIDINGHGCGCEHTPLHHLAMSTMNPSSAGASYTTNTMGAIMIFLAHPRVDVNAPSAFSRKTALHYCVQYGDYDLLDVLLARPDIDVNVKDSDGKTPLWYANTLRFNGDGTRRLLHHPEFDVNVTDLKGRTLLHHAISKGSAELVHMLLERDDLNVNAKDERGRTPLSRSVSSGNALIVSALIDHPSVDINLPDIMGVTPLHYIVVHRSNFSILVPARLLQREDIDVNIADHNGKTALSCAVEFDCVEMVNLLLGHKQIRVNAVDSEGRTALHSAVLLGKHAMVSQLLHSPTVDLCIRDKQGRTPLFYAKEGSAMFLELKTKTSLQDPLLSATLISDSINGDF